VLLPLGDATGGHGVPGVELIPGLLGDVPLSPWPLALPGVDGFELDELEFGVEPGVEFVAPGRVPHGEPLGEPPGLFGVFGLTVDGCVVLPGVGLVGVVEPGTVALGVPLGEVDPGVVCCVALAGGVAVPAGGVAVLAGGVAGLAGGVAVLAGGVAGEPGVEACPALPEPPAAGAAPDGAVCASAQLPQHSTTDNNATSDFDIKYPAFCSEPGTCLWHSAIQVSLRDRALSEYPAYAVDWTRRITELIQASRAENCGRRAASSSISGLPLNRVGQSASRGQGNVDQPGHGNGDE
jgi:hypothetical protein